MNELETPSSGELSDEVVVVEVAEDVEATESARIPRVLSVAGVAVQNTRGYPGQDRWAVGANQHGAWAIVADGISGGPRGAEAAEAATVVAHSLLMASTLDDVSMYRAFDAAHAAVAPWYRDREAGGTTLTIAIIDNDRVLIGHVGDSPAWVVHTVAVNSENRAGELPARVEQVTTTPGRRALTYWLGAPTAPDPLIVDASPNDVEYIVVCTDGVDPAHVEVTCRNAAANESVTSLVTALASNTAVDGDDATIAIIGLGPPTTADHEAPDGGNDG